MTVALDYIKDLNRGALDQANSTHYMKGARKGLSRELIEYISKDKNEPKWMLEHRLKSLEVFLKKPMPSFGPDLSGINFDEIIYYAKPGEVTNAHSWDQVPEDIKRTFERLGIPEAERKYLAGAGAQYESKNVYHRLKEKWGKLGVIFEDMDSALQLYPELVRRYFMKCVTMHDHKFAALHGAVWSGGTFIFIPAGVNVNQPLQAYFRMNAASMGQFEHTLIIVDKEAQGNYIEGCSSSKYESPSIHAGLVEIFVKENARFRYSSVENWSRNTYNLNTKRAIVEKNGVMEWIGGNMGCLTGNSLISTNPKGPIAIRNIKQGDRIFAYDEEKKSITRTKVTSFMFSGIKEVFLLEAGGRTIEATANHPFLTIQREQIKSNIRKGKFVLEWKSLGYLKQGDVIAINKKLPDFGIPYQLPDMSNYKNKRTISRNQYTDNFSMPLQHLFGEYNFPLETSKDFMWFLGILFGDGHIWLPEKHGAKINIAIPETCDVRKPLIKTIKKLFGYYVTYLKDRFIIINSRPIAEFLVKIGCGGTAATKKIPSWIYTLPISQKLAFLGGYFDSDGHIGPNGIYITSINKGLLEGVRELALECGIGFSHIFNHRKRKRNVIILGKPCIARKSYRILLNGSKVRSIITKSPSSKTELRKIRTKRNYSTKAGWNFGSLCTDEIGFARITKITPQGFKPTYDIEVYKHHNFIANGIIVHNSGVTMLYPCSVLRGEGSRADHLGIAFANTNQIQDTGAKVIHAAPNTTSKVVMKSLSKNGGKAVYRGLLNILKGAKGAKSQIKCDALILDDHSVSDTVPDMKIAENDVSIGHEASVGKISEEQLFYAMSRGLSEDEATAMIVNGFIEPIVKAMPLEYAVEMNRLIELEMETLGAVG